MDRDVCDRLRPTVAEIAQDRAAEHAERMRERTDWRRVRAEMVQVVFVGGRLVERETVGVR